ncbi:Zn-dependent oligopeptidase [bacterium]|nr:Zn-dependent oligopeptidase [bacterium]
MNHLVRALACLVFFIVGCNKMAVQSQKGFSWTFEYSAKEIETICAAEEKKLQAALDAIAKQTNPSFKTTFGAFEDAFNEFSTKLQMPIFLKYVSEKADIRDIAGKCEASTEKARIDAFAREDVYQVLKKAQAANPNADASDKKLIEKFMLAFRRNGLELAPAQRKVFLDKRKELVQLENDFGKELIEWKDHAEFTRQQLEGMPESVLERLEKTADGKFKVTVQYPDYFPFMENVKSGDSRKTMELHYNQRGGKQNKERLQKALALRNETAKMLGYADHAAYVLDDRMAKTPKAVSEFLGRIRKRISALGEKELAEMGAAKKKELASTKAESIQAWDWRYYDNLLRIQKHHIDKEAIKDYFPLDTVNKGMFEIYQTLLGVTFVEDPALPVWHKSVKGYRVTQNGKDVAVFYMDLYPRDGKYGHAAAFTLIKGLRRPDGGYEMPVSSIVANFTPPTADKPSLLDHDQVETHFHEFGHIMHQVLTQAKHATLSGTEVRMDFVEAPSQMLENWVWNPETLAKLSGHYKTHAKLPQDQLDRLIQAKLLNVGTRYLRQVFLASIDQMYHTHPPKDSTQAYSDLYKNITGVSTQPGTMPEAGFGHLMGGYDSGYYGYLWSEVYAQDMFTRFEKEGLLSPKVGADYRKWILEPGGETEPMELITKFLGRAPNDEAFYKSLGLKN